MMNNSLIDKILGIRVVPVDAIASELRLLRRKYRDKLEPRPNKDMWNEGWNDAIQAFVRDIDILIDILEERQNDGTD